MRVRVCVAVKRDGEWFADGWRNCEDGAVMSRMRYHAGFSAREIQFHWIEADVPSWSPREEKIHKGLTVEQENALKIAAKAYGENDDDETCAKVAAALKSILEDR
jgi:hypothetical protein